MFDKGIVQARKAAKLHSHREVLPFDKTGRNMVRVGVALSNLGYNPRNAWWGVPRFGSVELSIIAKQFRQLCEVHIRSEAFRNAHGVMFQAIRSESPAVGKALIQVPQEGPRIRPHALPDAEAGTYF